MGKRDEGEVTNNEGDDKRDDDEDERDEAKVTSDEDDERDEAKVTNDEDDGRALPNSGTISVEELTRPSGYTSRALSSVNRNWGSSSHTLALRFLGSSPVSTGGEGVVAGAAGGAGAVAHLETARRRATTLSKPERRAGKGWEELRTAMKNTGHVNIRRVFFHRRRDVTRVLVW